MKKVAKPKVAPRKATIHVTPSGSCLVWVRVRARVRARVRVRARARARARVRLRLRVRVRVRVRVGRRVGAHVRVSEQLDAVEGLQRLARDRRVQEEPRPDVEGPHLWTVEHGDERIFSDVPRGHLGLQLGW